MSVSLPLSAILNAVEVQSVICALIGLDGSGWRLEAQGAKPEQAGVTQVLHFHKRGEPSQNFELTTDTVQNYELAQLFVANLLGE